VKKFLIASLALFATASSAVAAETKIKIFPVQVEVVSGVKAAPTIYLANNGAEAVTFEALARGEVSAVFPPVATIEAGKRQAFRLVLPPINGGESTKAGAVRFVQISTNDFDAAQSGGKTELVFDVPVFLNAPDAAEKIVRIGKKIRNEGTKQVLITKIGHESVHIRLMPGEELAVQPGQFVFSGERLIEIEDGGDDEA
jgi:hypothetical protein